MRKHKELCTKISSALLVVLLFCTFTSQTVYAADNSLDDDGRNLVKGATSNDNSPILANTSNNDTMVVVSLGDSYSSGEGMTPFYGSEKSLANKVKDEDWLAHRSKISWPGRLSFPRSVGINGTLKDYNVKEVTNAKCKWYFRAVSGAETKHILSEKQEKVVRKKGVYNDKKKKEYLPVQLDIFNEITEPVDYVTLTIGGNDVGFVDILTTAVLESSYLSGAIYDSTTKGLEVTNLLLGYATKQIFVSSILEAQLNTLWRNIEMYKNRLEKTYNAIYDATDKNAYVLVAGYPKLLDQNGKGAAFSKHEAELINNSAHKFNIVIKELIEGLNNDKIRYVHVEDEFEGHEAYSKDIAWLNPIYFGAKDEDLNRKDKTSAFSMHPNTHGAQAYADCVNEEIKRIEREKLENSTTGILSGKVCKASNRTTPIPNANVVAYIKTHGIYAPISSTKSDSNGNYSLRTPAGDYLVKITADGYIDFNSYATVAKDETTYMETFLMVQGSESDKGIAKGRVVNSLAGTGVEGVNLSFRKYWNNTDASSTVVGTATTDADGYYTAELPLGNYTAVATKNGFLESTFNIIVQEGTTDNQNGTITPIVSGDDFLITLTWGENPNDLDSHVIGTLSSGDQFHVYYSDKSQYDGDTEVCNLDYDDTTSYGPEHITLKPTSDKPYYYYIHHYAGSGSISTSNAKIKVEKGGVLIRQFNVPTALGTDIYWNVFAIVNGEIVVKNTITPEPDIVYANNRNVSLRTLLASPNDITATEPKDDTEKDEPISDSQDKTSSTESSTPVATESEASSETESTVSSNEDTVSSEDATVSSEDTTSSTEEVPTEDSPVSSSDDTVSAAPKVQNQAAAVPAQKEEADDVSPSDTNN